MAQVCLLPKILYWRLRFWPTAPGIIFSRNTVSAITIGRTIHLDRPMPDVGRPPSVCGKSSQIPNADAARPSSNMPVMMAKDPSGLGISGDTCSSRMLFIPIQPMSASGTRNTSQINPAFWM